MPTASLPTYGSGGYAPASAPYVAPNYYHLPNQIWADKTPIVNNGVSSRADLSAVATPAAETQAQIAAINSPIRIIYGSDRIGAMIADVRVNNGKLCVIAVWGQGPIESVETIWMNDSAIPNGVTFTHYTGAPGQGVDATMAAAYAADGISYVDTFPGVAYSVFSVPATASSGFPSFTAQIKGLKVYDPRTGLTAWSDNPSLCLADFIASDVYGYGRPVDGATVIQAANDNDIELAGPEKRRLVGLTIESTNQTRQWIEALRAYAGCWVVQGDNGYKLIPDRPGASVMTFTDANIVADSMQLSKLGVGQLPTAINIQWTDPSVVPWSTRSAYVQLPGVALGIIPVRESQIPLPGIKRYSQAMREATERLNHFSLEDLTINFVAFDESLALECGDIITITHSVGLNEKLFRVTADPVMIDPGRWQITAREYDPAAYSDLVATTPTYADTALPDPAAPPAITGLSAIEEVYQKQNGTYSSRIRVNWDAVSYPYLAHYQIIIAVGGTVMFLGQADSADTTWPSPSIQEAVTYTVSVQAITTIGAAGTLATAIVTAQGKHLPPGNVPYISAFEVGGQTHLSWGAAIDIDIWRYKLAYGPVGGTYAAAKVITMVDGLSYTTGDIPAGNWIVYIVAIDSVRNESPTPASCPITVTLDNNAYLVDTYYHANPTLTGMAEYRLAPNDKTRYYVTEDGIQLDAKMNEDLSTYTDDLLSYNNVESHWTGEAEDFGLALSGTWATIGTATNAVGPADSNIQVSMDATTWTDALSTSVLATARFARTHHHTNAGSSIVVAMSDNSQGVNLNAIPRTQNGSGTSSAIGPTTITLPIPFAKFIDVQITPIGSVARSATPDNMQPGTTSTFDAYVFDMSGNKVAAPFNWTASGVG